MVASDATALDGQIDAETSVITFSLANTPVAYPLLVGESPTVRILVEMILPNRDSDYVDPTSAATVPHRVRLVIEDDGSGNLVESSYWTNAGALAGVYDLTGKFLDTTGTNEINYATGQCRLTFLSTGDDGSDPGIVLDGWDITGGGSEDLEIGDLKPLYSGEHAGSTIKFYAAYTYVFSPYRLFWTVYRGMTEMLSPDGVVLPSWDEFQFLPAAKNPSVDLGTTYAPIHAPVNAQYFGDMSELSLGGSPSSGVWEGEISDFSGGANVYAYANRPIGTLTPFSGNDFKAVWIRLNKPFNLDHASIGGTPAEACLSASVANLVGTVGDGDEELRRTNYTAKRYLYEKTVDITPSDSDETSLVQPLSLPLVGGSTRLSDVDEDTPDVDLATRGSSFPILWVRTTTPTSLPLLLHQIGVMTQMIC